MSSADFSTIPDRVGAGKRYSCFTATTTTAITDTDEYDNDENGDNHNNSKISTATMPPPPSPLSPAQQRHRQLREAQLGYVWRRAARDLIHLANRCLTAALPPTRRWIIRLQRGRQPIPRSVDAGDEEDDNRSRPRCRRVFRCQLLSENNAGRRLCVVRSGRWAPHRMLALEQLRRGVAELARDVREAERERERSGE